MSQDGFESDCPEKSSKKPLPKVSPADSNIGVFLWILRNFKEQLFLKNTFRGCFYQFDEVTTQYWASKTQCGMVSAKKGCESGQSMFFKYY